MGPVGGMTHGFADRECPMCGKERVCSTREVRQVFRTASWRSSGAMLDDADRACSFCRSVRIDGEWRRTQTVNSRAWELSEASSSKDASEYEEILTAGEGAAGGDTGGGQRSSPRDERGGSETESVNGAEW